MALGRPSAQAGHSPTPRYLRDMPRSRLCLLIAGLCATAPPVGAAELAVTVEGLRSGVGTVLLAVCPEARFLSRDGCPYTARVAAATAPLSVTLTGIEPGVYAVQAVHDENDNLDLDRNLVGWPLEGFGFSNAPPLRRGPPRFGDAAIRLGVEGAAVRLAIRYY